MLQSRLTAIVDSVTNIHEIQFATGWKMRSLPDYSKLERIRSTSPNDIENGKAHFKSKLFR